MSNAQHIGWLVVLMTGVMGQALAEDITVSTYYPSPRGVYDELRANTVEVNQSIRFNPTKEAVRPACEAATRGTVWFAQDVAIGGVVADALEFCALVNDQYQWVVVMGANQ